MLFRRTVDGGKELVQQRAIAGRRAAQEERRMRELGFTYAELAQQDGVMEMWTRYVEESAPEGGAPRGRWRAEAAEALALLLSAEYANKLVRFVCEVQVLLQQTYDVRAHMHEVREGGVCADAR